MRPERFDELLRNYRVTKARVARLKETMEMLDRFLRMCSSQMVNDLVSLSQALSGMPHGSGTGDPTGRLAMDIASGEVSPFVRQIQEEMTEANLELIRIEPQTRMVEIALGALSDKERDLVTMKMIDDLSWAEILHQMGKKHGGDCSKRTMQRALERAMKKAHEVVR